MNTWIKQTLLCWSQGLCHNSEFYHMKTRVDTVESFAVIEQTSAWCWHSSEELWRPAVACTTICLHFAAVAEILHKSNFCNFHIFVVSCQGKHSPLIGTTCFFIGRPENAKCLPNKNCISCSRHEIIWKRAYLAVKMTSLDQKDKSCQSPCIKIANLVQRYKLLGKCLSGCKKIACL